MSTQEVQHGSKGRSLADPGPKRIGRKPGQGKQPLGPSVIGQHPAERSKRHNFGIGSGGWRLSENCQSRL